MVCKDAHVDEAVNFGERVWRNDVYGLDGFRQRGGPR